jgi:hypothetical protein
MGENLQETEVARRTKAYEARVPIGVAYATYVVLFSGWKISLL